MQKTHDRIKPFIHKTPVLTSHLVNEIIGVKAFFKCENFQKMGAFKMRGATNAILQIPDALRANGVVTHSSGNMAQAVALAAKSIGIPAFIVMPDNAPLVKIKAVQSYGANIIFCKPIIAERQRLADQIVEEKNCSFIHPSNDIEVILGQGTAAMELIEEIPDLEVIIAPVGGGGLLAGTSLAAKYFGTDVKTIGAEPAEADDAYRSLAAGKILENNSANTIADGLRTILGDVNFPIICENVERIVRVSEDEIIEAMKIIFERMKIVIEASSAVAVAAAIKDKSKLSGKKVGIIISGGNVDLAKLPFD